MPLPPPDQPAAGRPASHPSRAILSSPLAAAARAGVYRRRTRERPRERGLRVFAMVGALLVHLLFLFAFVLGPAYEVKLPPEGKEQFVQVHLIETPETPPPPPVLGTPPKELGPRHQGHASGVVSSREQNTNARAAVVTQPTPASVPPVITQAAKSVAPAAKPVAAPAPPVSLPKPAPTPQLQPIPLASEPPPVSLPSLSLQPPVLPKFQPEPVRPSQLEGTRPLLPPPSLVTPELPAHAPPSIAMPNVAMNIMVPKSSVPVSMTPVQVQVPAAPPVPELQPTPLPAQPLPAVHLQAQLSLPKPSTPREQLHVQASHIDLAEAELEAVPPAPAAVQVQVRAPAAKIDVADKMPLPAIQPSNEPVQPSTSPAVVTTNAPALPASTANKPVESHASATSEQPAAAPSPSQASAERDLSSAPNASPLGSDTATPGEPTGVAAAPESETEHANGPPAKPGQSGAKGAAGKAQEPGQLGGSQPGAAEGAVHGGPNGYVQLKPSGDTEIMGHGTPNIGYKPTRFDGDWTPEDESSVDTALRHAVEKTTVAHTFHLPRGVRVECKVIPLLPMSLFGCGNPDPPPAPVAAKVYDRLHLAPANPVAAPTPAPAASTAATVAPIKLDNSVQCAEARVAGGPLPPGCEGIAVPATKSLRPASSSSSWVPASDQFH
ncbi:hypothetical protein [Rhodanobacter sp. C05]|uniref:hypothetical protein n=1 Tax=Rhodanobacter sp. C05 TaxID=1945855 RepID=UPI0020C595CC|nr:hypothetical protein [Rhodanobacter sp. C05]